MIDIEGIKSEMFFAPTYVGIKTKKSLKIKNLSPISILVKINIDNMVNGLVEVEENNGIKPHDIRRALEITRMYQEEFIKAWEEYHGE